jgi:DsbC/DsbD-like thiol-disulfide interchange protein
MMPGRVRWRLLLAVVLGLAPVGQRAATAEAPDVVSGRLVRADGALVIEATIESGWHVNAHEPRDEFLIPTTIDVTAPAGSTVGAIEYPKPVERRLAFSEDPLLLYEGTIRIRAALSGAGKGRFEARLHYQACDDTRCLPPKT